MPLDPCHLADEGHDQRGVDGGRGQRLEPRQDLLAQPLPRGWAGGLDGRDDPCAGRLDDLRRQQGVPTTGMTGPSASPDS